MYFRESAKWLPITRRLDVLSWWEFRRRARGVPQIEVTFDIDANGIVNVSAKDTATGKEQSIQITASSGMSKEEIDQAVKDAELHAEDDKKKKELVEARNHADSLVYSTEKSLKDLGDKVDADTRSKVEAAVADLKTAMESENVGRYQGEK